MRFSLVHELLERSARLHPTAPAVVTGDSVLDYATLEARSNALAHLLVDSGVKRGDRVGLYLQKSIDSVVGVYAILKAGAAYVPFDGGSPARRLAYIARDAGISHVVTAGDMASRWVDLVDNGAAITTLVSLSGRGSRPHGVRLIEHDPANAADHPPEVPVIGFDLAYVLYTSGSTGDPKGVMLTHQNALAFVLWAVEEFGVTCDDRLSSHAPFHFDLSVFDLFAAAAAAAAVVLVPPEFSVYPVELARLIREQRVTIWYSVPSVLTLLATRGALQTGDLPGLRTVLFAGEVLPTKYLRALMDLLPHAQFFNLFGPTETNVCTFYQVPDLTDQGDDPIPIGRAITGVEVFAVTEEGERARPGEVGELYVRGPTVMAGYLGDPHRTEGVLFPNRFNILGDPVYRTGDLVRESSEGVFDYVGRRDSQIKSRGYRIELGDIESALYAHPSVSECAVVAVRDELVSNRIVAHVVTQDELTARDLRRHLLERLPPYMVPEQIELVVRLPRTTNGKVDRQNLMSTLTEAR